jgi:hypothetical protein
MVFNGHTAEYVDSLDEELFSEIQVMYADGMLGNKAIFDALAPLTTAVFNYMRAANSPAAKVDQIFPWINEYAKNPDAEMPSEKAVSNSLLGFVSQAKGFDIKRFKR